MRLPTPCQYNTSNNILLGAVAGHPGKPNDITAGGASWSGASPYNIRSAETAPEMGKVNPWPPSTVQIVRRPVSNAAAPEQPWR